MAMVIMDYNYMVRAGCDLVKLVPLIIIEMVVVDE